MAAGFDIARVYRGAFLTRNRDVPEAELSAALDRAPEVFATAARARIESKGSEACKPDGQTPCDAQEKTRRSTREGLETQKQLRVELRCAFRYLGAGARPHIEDEEEG